MDSKPAINFMSNDVSLKDRMYGRVSGIIIDMTNWDTLDDSVQRQGIYPYVMYFMDANEKKQIAYATEMRSGGLDNMLASAKKDYRILVSAATAVKLICPKYCMTPSANKQACAHAIRVKDLLKAGLDALCFSVTDDNNIDKRLESVLDSIVHYSIISSYFPFPRTSECVFSESIYHYEKADDEYVQYAKGLEYEWDPRQFYGEDY